MNEKQTVKKKKKVSRSYRRILNKNSKVVGYLKGHFVYDYRLKLWGRYSGQKIKYGTRGTNIAKQSTFRNSSHGKIGYFDDHNNLFDIFGSYIGTVEPRNRKIWIIIPLIFLFLALAATSIFLGSYYVGSLGAIIDFGDDVPVLQVGSIYDKGQSSQGIDWNDERWLDILNSSIGDQIIMPGASGTYEFGVENTNESDAIISLTISDLNEYNIPMKFRLKMNNVYIAGDEDTWVTIDSLDFSDMKFAGESRVLFELEWEWDDNVSDENDTLIGTTEGSSYTLYFYVVAEVYE